MPRLPGNHLLGDCSMRLPTNAFPRLLRPLLLGWQKGSRAPYACSGCAGEEEHGRRGSVVVAHGTAVGLGLGLHPVQCQLVAGALHKRGFTALGEWHGCIGVCFACQHTSCFHPSPFLFVPLFHPLPHRTSFWMSMLCHDCDLVDLRSSFGCNAH